MAIFSLIKLQADYLLVVGVCLTLSVANIIGFTKCQKGMLICVSYISKHIYWFKVGSLAHSNLSSYFQHKLIHYTTNI